MLLYSSSKISKILQGYFFGVPGIEDHSDPADVALWN